MIVDTIVLAGGRSRRLGGLDKTALVYNGQTLLDRAVEAASGTRTVVVVGPTQLMRTSSRRQVIFTLERPPFGGPVAGVAAGVAALGGVQAPPSDVTLVVAGDLAHPEEAVAGLLEVASRSGGRPPLHDGIVGVDGGGHRQYLLACYRTDSLARALDGLPDGGRGVSMRALTADLHLDEVTLREGLTEDVDTWDDAARIGVVRAASQEGKEAFRWTTGTP